MAIRIYFAKMMFRKNSTYTWINACDHMGEAKLFGYIITTCDKNTLLWNYDKFKERALLQLLNVSRASIFSYLKLLSTDKGCGALLVKEGRGLYRVNEKYIDFK